MGFARSERGLEYALVQDATDKSVGEIRDMGDADRYATAMIRARFWTWWGESMFGGG